MERKSVALLGVILAMSLSGCNLPNKKQAEKKDKEDREQAQEVFKAWVDAHNSHSLSGLDTLYADEVFYYSKNFKKRDLLADKAKALKPGSDLRIEAIDPHWEFSGDEAKVNYEKYSYWQGKEIHVVSELSLKKQGNAWKITRELDLEVKKVGYEITKEEAWKKVEEFVASKRYGIGRDLGEEMKGPVTKNGISCWKATGPYYDREVGLIGDYEIYVSVKDGSIVSHKLTRIERRPY